MILRAVAVVCAVLAIVTASYGTTLAGAGDGGQEWLVASDIHLNPFDRSKRPVLFGSDTNLALFASTLAAMKRAVPNPAMVLLPGDFFVHDFPRLARRYAGRGSAESAAVETMRAMAGLFNRTFPSARFAIALGNNDAPCGDYRSDAGDRYLASVAHIWAPLLDRHGDAADFITTFARGGYYTAALPVRGLRLVVLNTVPFSKEYRGSCGGDASDAAANELAWLDATLRATRSGTRNLVMMHIPPGYDAFSTQVTHGFAPWPFLQARDNDALIDAISAPGDHVAYALASHTHHFDFRLARGVPVVVFGSISPVYHNDPAFYALHVEANGALRDIDTYAYDEWTQSWLPARSFDRTWGVGGIDATTFEQLHARLGDNPSMRRAWDAASSAWPSNRALMWATWGRFWRISWCAQTVLSSGFAQCAGIEHRVIFFRVLIAAIGIVALVLLVALVRVALTRKRAMPHLR